MHRYGKGGDSAETSLQEVSQSLQSTLVMMRANKEKDTNKNIQLLLLPIIHFLAAQNCRDCREQINVCCLNRRLQTLPDTPDKHRIN